jgi:energy-coupling factor transporter ATP-binding protein EcfA2
MRQRKVSGEAETEVDFAELEDGSLAEMIEDPVCPTKTLLAVYKDGNVRYVEKWRDGSRTLVPIPRHGQVLNHICFPAGCESYLGLEELERDVAPFFFSCADFEVVWRMGMTGFVFSTWNPETLPVAPYLALLGPPGSGKTTVMRILRLLCRRSLPVSDISSAGFYDVCNRLSPTLLIDEAATAGHPRTLLHLLRSSSSPGFVSLRKGTAQMAYGPKVLAWTELPNDPALISRCLIIPMHKTSRTDLISPDDPKVLEFAKRVRMRLQQFRFEHYRSLPIPKVPASVQLSSRPLDIYRALALPVGKDQNLCTILAHLVADQSQFQSPLISALQASAVRNLHRFIHFDSKAAGYKLKGLTQAMMADLVSRGEPSRLNERKVGDVLTSLGFTSRSRTNPGTFTLWLQRSDRIRIHEMARDYEVEGAVPDQYCDICKEINKASPITVTSEISEQTQVPNTEKREQHEHRERHERISVAATPAVNRRSKRRHSRLIGRAGRRL